MAYYTPNNNSGIPTLDLTEFGLTQPQENMQVAEAINYNTLKGAQNTFTPEFPMGAKMNLGVKEFMHNNPTPTKSSFIEALERGDFGGATGGMFDKNVGTLFEGVPLDASLFSTEVGDVNPQFISPKGSFGGTIDIKKDQLSNPEALPKGFFKGVGDQSSLIGPGGYPMTAMAMNPNRMTDAYSGFFNQGDAISRTNVQGMDNEMDPGARINPNIQPSQNMFQRAGNFINDLDLEEYLPFIGEKSLTGMLGRGIGNLFQNIAPARYGTSQRAYNALSPQGRSAVGSIYGPGGIMQGYNAVSAFGRGPVGAIQNRIDNILARKEAGKKYGKTNLAKLQQALTNVGGGDSGGGGGYSQSSVDAGVQAAEDDR